jgi:hypothetical protein
MVQQKFHIYRSVVAPVLLAVVVVGVGGARCLSKVVRKKSILQYLTDR